MTPGALDALTKDMIYVAVSVTKQCGYCIASHTAAARKNGMSEAMFAELMVVVGLANETNRLAAVEIDERSDSYAATARLGRMRAPFDAESQPAKPKRLRGSKNENAQNSNCPAYLDGSVLRFRRPCASARQCWNYFYLGAGNQGEGLQFREDHRGRLLRHVHRRHDYRQQ